MSITLGRRSFILSAGAVLLTITAWAQLGTATKFMVPFSFESEGKVMPSGRYDLVKGTDRVAVLRNIKGSCGLVTSWRQSDSTKPDQAARLVFMKSGDRYILKSGEIPGFIAEWNINKKKMMTLQAQEGAQEVVILARR